LEAWVLVFLKLTGRLFLVAGLIFVSGSLSAANRASLASLFSSKAVVIAPQHASQGEGLHRSTFDRHEESLHPLGFAPRLNAEAFFFSPPPPALAPQGAAFPLKCSQESPILRV
jgi:hypothetical protein